MKFTLKLCFKSCQAFCSTSWLWDFWNVKKMCVVEAISRSKVGPEISKSKNKKKTGGAPYFKLKLKFKSIRICSHKNCLRKTKQFAKLSRMDKPRKTWIQLKFVQTILPREDSGMSYIAECGFDCGRFNSLKVLRGLCKNRPGMLSHLATEKGSVILQNFFKNFQSWV